MSDSISLTEKNIHIIAWRKLVSLMGIIIRDLRLQMSILGNKIYVYLDSNNQIVGDQNASETFANIMRELHSSLLVGGTVVNYTVELAACWTIF